MIKIVAKDGEAVEAPTAAPHPEVVAHLERLLDRARNGQIDVLAFIAWGKHKSDTGYAGIEELGDGIYLMGCLVRLQNMLAERVETLAAPVAEFVAPDGNDE